MDFLGRKSINLLIDGLSTCKKSISPGFTYIVKFLTLKSPSITVKLIDGLFKGRKSINLFIDGLSTKLGDFFKIPKMGCSRIVKI